MCVVQNVNANGAHEDRCVIKHEIQMLQTLFRSLEPSRGILGCLIKHASSCTELALPSKKHKRIQGYSGPMHGTVSKYDVHILLRLPFIKGG